MIEIAIFFSTLKFWKLLYFEIDFDFQEPLNFKS